MNKQKFYRVFFAPDTGTGAGGAEGTETGAGTEQQEGQGGQQQEEKPEEKQFTQTELNKLLAAEKRQGKNSVYKELGFKDAADAKAQLEALKAFQDSQKTAEEKAAAAQKELEQLKTSKDAELALMSAKLEAVKLGVLPNALDDFAALAASKLAGGQELKDIVEDMKKNPVYSGFFNSNNNAGTGSAPGGAGGGKNSSKENIGERLGKARAASVQNKSTFFKN